MRLALVGALALLAGCGRPQVEGPVRTPREANEIAQRTLRSAHLDEEILSTERQGGGAWIVTTRWRESSMAGHLLTIDPANGNVTVERYRTLQIGRQP